MKKLILFITIFSILITTLYTADSKNSCDISTRPTNNGHIKYIFNPSTSNQVYTQNSLECGYTCKDGYKGKKCDEKPVITSKECSSAGWEWIPPSSDVYIGDSQSTSGFCISPVIGDFGDLHKGMGWNGWGTSLGGNGVRHDWEDYYLTGDKNAVGEYPDGLGYIDNPGNSNGYGHDALGTLDSPLGYRCIGLGDSKSDYIDKDNIVGRMKWLRDNKNVFEEIRDIEWVMRSEHKKSRHTVIPALFIADCLDGVKDLGTDMTYTHRDNNKEQITYSEYNKHLDIISYPFDYRKEYQNETYQNRQKYLLGWTQKSGSHLPSGFSYIDSGTPGGCSSTDCYDLTIDKEKGEFQLACELEKVRMDRRYIMLFSSVKLNNGRPNNVDNKFYEDRDNLCGRKFDTSPVKVTGEVLMKRVVKSVATIIVRP